MNTLHFTQCTCILDGKSGTNSSSYTISEDKLGAVKQNYNWKTVKLEINMYIVELCLLGQDVI